MKTQNNHNTIQSSRNHRSFQITDTFLRRTTAARRLLSCVLALVALLTPQYSHACAACGCGFLDLAMFPEGQGGLVFLEYDFLNQNHNWSGNSMAPGENNNDQRILSHSITLGLQYMFNSSWGVQLELPYVSRSFTTISNAIGGPVKLSWSGLGDMRIKGIYTGLLQDQSLGVTFGLRLPTGDYKHNDAFGDIDRDTQIGSGSTDLLLGIFYHHQITKDNKWRWFAQANLDVPMFSQDGYCPGTALDATLGIYYNGWSIGKVKIKPIAQVTNSYHWSDCGPNSAQPVASGYERILLSPGVQIDIYPVMINASVDFPVFQQVTGNQLVAPALVKLSFSLRF